MNKSNNKVAQSISLFLISQVTLEVIESQMSWRITSFFPVQSILEVMNVPRRRTIASRFLHWITLSKDDVSRPYKQFWNGTWSPIIKYIIRNTFGQRFLQDDNDSEKYFPPVEQIETFVPHDSSRRRRDDGASTRWGLRISTLRDPVIDVTQVLTKSKSLNQKQGECSWTNVCRQLHSRIHDYRQCTLHRTTGLIHRLCPQRPRGKDVRCDKRWRNLSIRASTTRGSWWYARICAVIKNWYAKTSNWVFKINEKIIVNVISHIHNCHWR